MRPAELSVSLHTGQQRMPGCRNRGFVPLLATGSRQRMRPPGGACLAVDNGIQRHIDTGNVFRIRIVSLHSVRTANIPADQRLTFKIALLLRARSSHVQHFMTTSCRLSFLLPPPFCVQPHSRQQGQCAAFIRSYRLFFITDAA